MPLKSMNILWPWHTAAWLWYKCQLRLVTWSVLMLWAATIEVEQAPDALCGHNITLQAHAVQTATTCARQAENLCACFSWILFRNFRASVCAGYHAILQPSEALADNHRPCSLVVLLPEQLWICWTMHCTSHIDRLCVLHHNVDITCQSASTGHLCC